MNQTRKDLIAVRDKSVAHGIENRIISIDTDNIPHSFCLKDRDNKDIARLV